MCPVSNIAACREMGRLNMSSLSTLPGAASRPSFLHFSFRFPVLSHWETIRKIILVCPILQVQEGGRERRRWRMKRPGSPMRQRVQLAYALMYDYAEL